MSVIYLRKGILTQCDETSFKDLNCKVHVYSSSRGLPDGAVLLAIHMVGHVLWIVERILRFHHRKYTYIFFGVNTTFTYSLCSVKMFPHGVVDLQTSLQSGQKMKVALCSSGWFTYSAGSTVYETETHKSWRENFDMRARRIFLESTFSTTAWFKERRAL